VWKVDTNDAGKLMAIHVRVGRGASVSYPIENVVIFTNGDETRSWQGYSELGASLDEYIMKRSWRSAALVRARAYARVVHLLMTKDAVSDADKAEIKASFPHGDAAVVQGEWGYQKIGGNLEAGELDRVMEDSIEAMAVGAGITKNDMKGSEAGQKLSTDSNQHHFFAEVRSIQDEYLPACADVFQRFGIKIEGFNDAWTMTKTQNIQLRIQLLQMLSTTTSPVVTKHLELMLEEL
jgi:hypothetical protein